MEINWKSKAVAPIEKEIAELDRQIVELALRKAAFEKALSLFNGGIAGVAPSKIRRGRPKKQPGQITEPIQKAG